MLTMNVSILISFGVLPSSYDLSKNFVLSILRIVRSLSEIPSSEVCSFLVAARTVHVFYGYCYSVLCIDPNLVADAVWFVTVF